MTVPQNRLGNVKTMSLSREHFGLLPWRWRRSAVLCSVMGSTGVGKSSFTKLVTGDESIVIGHSIESETTEVQTSTFRDPATGRKVILVDTPGFDDSRAGVTDTDVLKKIAEFLVNEWTNGDSKIRGQAGTNLRMFRKLCGTDPFKNVVVLTTFWNRVDNEEEGLQREAQLKSKFFNDLVDGGARFMRHDRTAESASEVLKHIFTLVPTNVRIQEEMRVEDKTLEETAAGSVRREQVERLMAKHKEEMSELKAEMGRTRKSDKAERRALEKELANLRQESARWQDEIAALKKGLDDERSSRERLEADIAEKKDRHEEKRAIDRPPPDGKDVLMEEEKRLEDSERQPMDAEDKPYEPGIGILAVFAWLLLRGTARR
ncbi:P-loop containing nucleoside triphosphate hydrolase protein [Mycena capillaripes]|nr:P-loop containing nucleoside triphosphate hydrolase protein [Mycena capillaripes]